MPSLFCPLGHHFVVLSPWEIGKAYDHAHIASALLLVAAAPRNLSLSTSISNDLYIYQFILSVILLTVFQNNTPSVRAAYQKSRNNTPWATGGFFSIYFEGSLRFCFLYYSLPIDFDDEKHLRQMHQFFISCDLLTGAGTSRWSDPPALGPRPPVKTGGRCPLERKELPTTPCSLSFES
jgi:hypothetical protein